MPDRYFGLLSELNSVELCRKSEQTADYGARGKELTEILIGNRIPGLLELLERLLALDFDKVIPGHGRVTDRAGLLEFQRFIAEVAEFARVSAAAGKSLEATLAAANLEHDGGFEEMSIPFVLELDRDFAIRRAWEEASGLVHPVELSAPESPGSH